MIWLSVLLTIVLMIAVGIETVRVIRGYRELKTQEDKYGLSRPQVIVVKQKDGEVRLAYQVMTDSDDKALSVRMAPPEEKIKEIPAVVYAPEQAVVVETPVVVEPVIKSAPVEVVEPAQEEVIPAEVPIATARVYEEPSYVVHTNDEYVQVDQMPSDNIVVEVKIL